MHIRTKAAWDPRDGLGAAPSTGAAISYILRAAGLSPAGPLASGETRELCNLTHDAIRHVYTHGALPSARESSLVEFMNATWGDARSKWGDRFDSQVLNRADSWKDHNTRTNALDFLGFECSQFADTPRLAQHIRLAAVTALGGLTLLDEGTKPDGRLGHLGDSVTVGDDLQFLYDIEDRRIAASAPNAREGMRRLTETCERLQDENKARQRKHASDGIPPEARQRLLDMAPTHGRILIGGLAATYAMGPKVKTITTRHAGMQWLVAIISGWPEPPVSIDQLDQVAGAVGIKGGGAMLRALHDHGILRSEFVASTELTERLREQLAL